jgi:1-acyl-sn-glycerol-3-phosphate acyltransferase
LIEARRLRGFDPTFGRYVRWLLRRSFRGVWLNAGAAFPESGCIAISNHASWWDGLIPYAVQRAIAPNVPFYLMMTQAQLRRFWFFRFGGAFSIDVASPRESVRSIAYGAARASEGAAVWIYPQGRLESGDPEHLHGGYLHAARAARKPVVVVALRLAFLEAQRPDAFVEVSSPIGVRDAGANARVLGTLRAQLSRIDAQIASGRPFAGRSPLFAPAAGPDDVTARIGAVAGDRFAR